MDNIVRSNGWKRFDTVRYRYPKILFVGLEQISIYCTQRKKIIKCLAKRKKIKYIIYSHIIIRFILWSYCNIKITVEVLIKVFDQILSKKSNILQLDGVQSVDADAGIYSMNVHQAKTEVRVKSDLSDIRIIIYLNTPQLKKKSPNLYIGSTVN